MQLTTNPGYPLRGEVTLPGDKSLSHRAVLFAAMAEGNSVIHNFLVSGVTRVMLESLTLLGVSWELTGDKLYVYGNGVNNWSVPETVLDCGNSATTMRLLAGAVASAGIPVCLDGSSGLRRRPMDRIVVPLRQMNVEIETAEGEVAPLRFRSRSKDSKLIPFRSELPVASAQVKSCILLAALAANGETILREPGPSRDHTERMLRSMGVNIESSFYDKNGSVFYETKLHPKDGPLQAISLTLPGDSSAAAFLIVAGLITPGSEILIRGVGLNPTRTGLIDALKSMGGDILILNQTNQAGEPSGDIIVRYSPLTGTEISGSTVVRMIDEFSVFAVAAAYARGETIVRDAAELRYKESDRIGSLKVEMEKVGVSMQEERDGFTISGGKLPSGGMVNVHGDHRLAMAMSILGLASSESVNVIDAEIIGESFPGFSDCLQKLGAKVEMVDAVPGER